MAPFLYVLISAIGAGLLAFSISAISSNPRKRPIFAFLAAGVVNFLLALIVVYIARPEFTHWATGGYITMIWWILLTGLVIGVGFSGLSDSRGDFGASRSALVAIGIIVAFVVIRYGIVSAATPPHWVDVDGKRTLAAQLELAEGVTQTPDLDINKAIKVTPTHAKTKAQAAFPQNLNLGSYLELGDGYLQNVEGNPYYVFAFSVKDRRGFERRGSIIPGYIIVDASNKSGSAEWRPLEPGQEIRYVHGSLWWWDSQLIDRHVYFNYALSSNARIAELSGMELDDDGKPWYTATVLKPSVGYTAYEPKGLITVDPVTGEIVEYGMDEVPQWVDRIYPSDTIDQYVSWWGDWNEATPRFFGGSRGLQKKIDKTSLVWGPDGLMHQYVMRSKGSDKTATDVIYVNMRTGVAERYPIDSATQSTVDQIVEQKAFEEHKIPLESHNCQIAFLAGESVWYCLLEREGISWGVAVVQPQYAKAADATRVLISESLNDVYEQLLTQVAEDASASGETVDNSSTTTQIVGTIERVGNTYFQEGQWYLPFSLRLEDEDEVLTLRISAEKPSSHFLRDGDEVTVTAIRVTSGTPDTVIEVENHTYPK